MNHEAAVEKEKSSGIFSNEEQELLSLKKKLYSKLLDLDNERLQEEVNLLKALSQDKQFRAFLDKD